MGILQLNFNSYFFKRYKGRCIELQMVACSRVRNWYYYIIASLVTFFGGIFVIGLTRFAMFIYFRCAGAGWRELNNSSSTSSSSSSVVHGRFSLFSRVRAAGRSLLSGDPWWSKTLVSAKLRLKDSTDDVPCYLFKQTTPHSF